MDNELRPICLARLFSAILVLFLAACSSLPELPQSPDVPAHKPAIVVDHVVHSTPENLSWGWFPIDRQPALTVKSGATVEVHTLTGSGSSQEEHPIDELGYMGIPESEVLPDLVEFWRIRESRPREGRSRHLITGPVYVEDAEPGDMLEIQILDIQPRVPWGVNGTAHRSGVFSMDYPGFREGDPALDIPPETPDLPPETWRVIRTENINGQDVGVYPSGIKVPLAPFMGILAVAPNPVVGEPGVEIEGVQASGPPGAFGGNLDVKHLTAGTKLFLPVFHHGAQFYVGDPHGAQGDGEVSGTAIEQSMTGIFRLVLHKNVDISLPRGETPTHYLIMGIDLDLDRALRNATYEVVAFLVKEKGLRPSEAFSLASVAVDFTVSEAVDDTQVITALVPKAIFE